MEPINKQLTVRGIIIGCIGCIIITAASAYTALKLGALPWPIVFAAIISLFFLKALGRGKANLHEANVTHTIMSAGAMVAGGLAFTIPGTWMLGLADEVSWAQMAIVAFSGVALGLLCTGFLRRHFIEEADLEFPIGEAAAQSLIAGNSGGKLGAKLFSAMGLAGVYTALRDILGMLPTMLLSGVKIPGVTFGIYNSPMMLAVGFLVGTGAVMVWFLGAVIGNFGIIAGGTAAGLWDTATAQGIVSSLGMGCMMGAGIGVIVKDIVPAAVKRIKSADGKANVEDQYQSAPAASSVQSAQSGKTGNSSETNVIGAVAASTSKTPRSLALYAALVLLAMAAVAHVLCWNLGLGFLVAWVVVLLVWVTTAMSAQSVGQTGIDPMEIFGLIVLLAAGALSDLPQVQLFFVAAIIAVACGLAGDVMNDFHAGHVLGTSPKAQMIGQSIGAVVGAVVAVAVMVLLLNAYGPEAFGPQGSFISAQASVVATMVSGIPCAPAFWIGLAGGLVLYLVKFPAMMLGLGIYLPFYMSFTAFLGALIKLAYDAICKARNKNMAEGERATHAAAQQENGLIIASGILGGESIIGIVSAIFLTLSAL